MVGKHADKAVLQKSNTKWNFQLSHNEHLIAELVFSFKMEEKSHVFSIYFVYLLDLSKHGKNSLESNFFPSDKRKRIVCTLSFFYSSLRIKTASFFSSRNISD